MSACHVAGDKPRAHAFPGAATFGIRVMPVAEPERHIACRAGELPDKGEIQPTGDCHAHWLRADTEVAHGE